MKTKSTILTALALLPAVICILTACSSTSQPSPAVGAAVLDYTKGVPGGVIVQTFKATVTLTAVDQPKRLATLLGADGKKFTVKVSAEVGNFDQLRVGDRVSATVVQKIVARLDKEGTSSDRATTGVVPTPKDGQTVELIPTIAQVAAKVVALNPEKHTATLQFANGSTETLPIREDVDLSRHKLGEQVVFHVTEMTAIRLEKL